MAHQPILQFAAGYTMKAALQKSASSSYITKFPMHKVRMFAGQPPVSVSVLRYSICQSSESCLVGPSNPAAKFKSASHMP
jgi:hypothetical protein